MAADEDKVNRPTEADEDIILLTEVVEEPPSEVVLEIPDGKPGLDALFQEDAPSQSAQETSGPAEADDDLSDFLASLKDLPEDLGTPAVPAAVPPKEPEPGDPGERMMSVSEGRLKEFIREAVQEIVAKLSHDVAPQIVSEVLDRKIGALFKGPAEEE